MNIRLFFEKYILLRSLNYLRIKSEYSFNYLFYYPFLCTSLVFTICLEGGDYSAFLGVFSDIKDLTTLLIPFYIASLTAISTFGKGLLDQAFKTIKPIEIRIRVSPDRWEDKRLNPKNYLRLLFAYANFNSIFIFSLISITGFARNLTVEIESFYAHILTLLYYFIILFLFAQLCFITMLGIYFLSDYLVRNENP